MLSGFLIANSMGVATVSAGRLIPIAQSEAGGPGRRVRTSNSPPSARFNTISCSFGFQGVQTISSIAMV